MGQRSRAWPSLARYTCTVQSRLFRHSAFSVAMCITLLYMCRSHGGHMQVTCRSHAGHMYVTCRSHVCCVGSRGNAVWIPLHLLFSQGSPGCFYLLPQKAVTPVKLAKNGDMRIFWKVLGSFMSRLSPLGSSLHLLESNCAGNRQGEEVRTYTSTCIE